MSKIDTRLNAIRPDLVDLALQGRVTAPRYARGEDYVVVMPQAPVRRDPSPAAALDTEALAGEGVRVFETTDEGWAWCQLQRDRYVGWMPSDCLGRAAAAATHKVTAVRTLVFRGPNIKEPPLAGMPMGAKVHVRGETEDHNARYALIEPAGAIVVQHLATLDRYETDPASVAERFSGVPYLWGGKTALGIDCSGLVQVALEACGLACPRDTDMQENALGAELPIKGGMPQLRRGDLVFWKGHVGIMQDGEMLLHGNAYHMAVASEPLRDALVRYASKGLGLSSIRRITPAAE